MNSFISRPMVITQTVGERLKKVRLGNGLSITQVSRQIGIAERYLLSIEDGEYGELPGEIYCLEFIKTYGRFLRLGEESVVAAYRAEKQRHSAAPSSNFYSARFLSPWLRLFSALTITRATVALGLLGLVVWAPFAIAAGTEGPRLEVFSPDAYYRIHDSRVVLSGATDPESTVLVNNQRLSVDAAGSFHAAFNAPPGLTLIEISAIDSRGRRSTEYRTVVVDRGQVAGARTQAEIPYNP